MLIGFAREVQQLRDLGVKDIILDRASALARPLRRTSSSSTRWTV
jgi:hypothetical protein